MAQVADQSKFEEAAPPAEPDGQAGATRYGWYVLSILFLVYVLNFVDRQIISILAEDIKRDLGLKDQDLGFLYGTAFGVFYALFGIPLGRLADNWHRVRLMTIGLTLWSVMTAVSGLSRTGGHLAAARIGVGIGEATARAARLQFGRVDLVPSLHTADGLTLVGELALPDDREPVATLALMLP